MTTNFIGAKLYISAALPATNDAAGFEALSWTLINGLVSGPQFGYNHDVIEIPDLGSGFADAVKGMGSGTDTSFAYRNIDADAGQVLVRANAIDDDGNVSLKLVVTPTGVGGIPATGDEVEYAQGFLHTYLKNQPTATAYTGATVNFRVRYKPVVATEPA